MPPPPLSLRNCQDLQYPPLPPPSLSAFVFISSAQPEAVRRRRRGPCESTACFRIICTVKSKPPSPPRRSLAHQSGGKIALSYFASWRFSVTMLLEKQVRLAGRTFSRNPAQPMPLVDALKNSQEDLTPLRTVSRCM